MELIREFRHRQQPPITQEALGKRIGLSKASISRIEAGKQQIERDVAIRLSRVTDIPAAKLLDLESA